VTVRVGRRHRDLLKRTAEEMGVPMQTVLQDAIETYRRQVILRAANNAYAATRQDRTERDLWDATLVDGLEDEAD
jgi:hypothetical protein